jgi:hypothetical protein
MKMTPSQVLAGLSLLASVSAFASDPTSVSAPSNSDPVSQEPMKAFVYEPNPTLANPAPVTPPQVAINNGAADVAKDAPVTMSPFVIKESPERQFRAVRDAMAYPDPTTPHALITKELRNGAQFEALGAPIDRTWSETVIGGLQPRFPLVGINF